MQAIINLLAKVPAAGRFPVLIALAGIGFYFGMNGWSGDGPIWQGIVGTALFAFVVYIFHYLITHKTQL